MSVGRTVPFTPLGGKFGYANINGVNLNVAQWSPTQNNSTADCTNFNSPKDGNGNPHAEMVPTIVKTSFNVTGVRDGSVTGYQPTAGDAGTGVLGYSPALFFNVQFYVTSVGGECKIDGVSAVQFGIEAVGLAVMAGSNGGA